MFSPESLRGWWHTSLIYCCDYDYNFHVFLWSASKGSFSLSIFFLKKTRIGINGHHLEGGKMPISLFISTLMIAFLI